MSVLPYLLTTFFGMAAGVLGNIVATHFQAHLGRNRLLLVATFLVLGAWSGVFLYEVSATNPDTTHVYYALYVLSAGVGAGWIACIVGLIRKRSNPARDLPKPPVKYFFHDYILLTTKRLIGRRAELEQLTKWVSKTQAETRILIVQAIGGQGKSVLARTWFNDLNLKASQFDGGMWWSFYDPSEGQNSAQPLSVAQRDESILFDRFVTHALAYAEQQTTAETANLPIETRQQQLLDVLQRRPFLLVLDGFERLMTLYTSTLAASPSEDEIEKARTAIHRKKRETADLRVGEFLRQCANAGKSRILITSRLPPADLEKREGGLRQGCEALNLEGLIDSDALELWTEMGARGTPATIQQYLRSFNNHPLLIQILAGEVKLDGGDFDSWLVKNSGFNPAEHLQREEHILSYAFLGLSEAERRTLYVIAVVPRTPIRLDTAAALLVKEDGENDSSDKAFGTQYEMREVLKALRDRGLLGWRQEQRYLELHPIVRDNVRKLLKKNPAEEGAVLEMVRQVLQKELEGVQVRANAAAAR